METATGRDRRRGLTQALGKRLPLASCARPVRESRGYQIEGVDFGAAGENLLVDRGVELAAGAREVPAAVVVEAPLEAVTAMLTEQPAVRALVDDGWLHPFALGDAGCVTHRSAGGLRRVPVAPASGERRAADTTSAPGSSPTIARDVAAALGHYSCGMASPEKEVDSASEAIFAASAAPGSALPDWSLHLRGLPPDLAPAILDVCPLSIVLTDAGLDEPSPRILYVNAAFCRMTGYSQEQVIGRSPRFLQGPETSREVLDLLRQALIQRKPFECETWNYRIDGTPFLMHWTVSPVRSPLTGAVYFFATQEDVTDLRRLEAIAETSNLMENIGYVFSGIRHELGNPINSVKAALTMLRRGFEHYPAERIASTLDRVLDEVKRVEYLLRELRSFNALEPPESEWVELEPFLQRFLSLAAPDCEARGCGLKVVIEPSAPTYGYCDRRGMHQVILNLVTNALDALTAPQGESHAAEPSTEGLASICLRVVGGAKGAWRIDVEDTGPGVAEGVAERIFTPFFTTKTTGTGLGLPLVRRVLARMGGTVELKPSVGRGATFSIWLPGKTQVDGD